MIRWRTGLAAKVNHYRAFIKGVFQFEYTKTTETTIVEPVPKVIFYAQLDTEEFVAQIDTVEFVAQIDATEFIAT